MGLKEKATEANVREYINTTLELTDSTKSDIGISQVYRLGRHPEGTEEIISPVIVEFKTTTTVDTIINAARGQGVGGIFKEHIPDDYISAHNDFVKLSTYLREEKQYITRVRFVDHSLQLQGKLLSSEDYSIIRHFTPPPQKNKPMEEDLNKLEIQLTNEDTMKVTMFLGKIIIDDATLTEAPKELTDNMVDPELGILIRAFQNTKTKLPGNILKLTCIS